MKINCKYIKENWIRPEKQIVEHLKYKMMIIHVENNDIITTWMHPFNFVYNVNPLLKISLYIVIKPSSTPLKHQKTSKNTLPKQKNSLWIILDSKLEINKSSSNFCFSKLEMSLIRYYNKCVLVLLRAEGFRWANYHCRSFKGR